MARPLFTMVLIVELLTTLLGISSWKLESENRAGAELIEVKSGRSCHL